MSLIGVGEVADLIKTALERFVPDPAIAAKAKADLDAAVQAGQLQIILGQIQTNTAEASSSSVFIAGWRPFIGWVCGVSCAWNWIGLPVALFVATALGHSLALKPADLSDMWPVLTGMLGIGVLRTAEKITGSEKNR